MSSSESQVSQDLSVTGEGRAELADLVCAVAGVDQVLAGLKCTEVLEMQCISFQNRKPRNRRKGK